MNDPARLRLALAAFEQARQAQAGQQLAEAAAHYRRALELAPGHPGIVAGYAALATAAGDWAAAATLYRRLGQLQPDSGFEGPLAIALFRQQQFSECAQWLERHLARHPGDIGALRAKGLCHTQLQQWQAALDCGRQLERVADDEQSCELVLNGLFQLGDGDELDARVESALARYPGNAAIASLCGLHLLKRGDFRRGFAHQRAIRWRYDKDHPDPTQWPADAWDGQRFDGTLLVAGEQGLGEELLASGLFADLVALGQPTVVECEPRLLPVFRRSFPALDFVPRWQGELERIAAGGRCRRVKSLDLAVFLRRDAGSFPPRAGWLLPDAARVEKLRADYRQRWPGRRLVGLSWKSSRVLGPDGDKSLPAASLVPLLARDDLAGIDVQYGAHDDDLELLRRHGATPPWRDPDIDARDDLDGLLAQLCALDGLLTISNSTAHLAGAAGVPACVLLPRRRPVFWYWGYAGEHTPWYPSLTLLRNDSESGHEPLIRLAGERLCASRPATESAP